MPHQADLHNPILARYDPHPRIAGNHPREATARHLLPSPAARRGAARGDAGDLQRFVAMEAATAQGFVALREHVDVLAAGDDSSRGRRSA